MKKALLSACLLSSILLATTFDDAMQAVSKGDAKGAAALFKKACAEGDMMACSVQMHQGSQTIKDNYYELSEKVLSKSFEKTYSGEGISFKYPKEYTLRVEDGAIKLEAGNLNFYFYIIMDTNKKNTPSRLQDDLEGTQTAFPNSSCSDIKIDGKDAYRCVFESFGSLCARYEARISNTDYMVLEVNTGVINNHDLHLKFLDKFVDGIRFK